MENSSLGAWQRCKTGFSFPNLCYNSVIVLLLVPAIMFHYEGLLQKFHACAYMFTIESGVSWCEYGVIIFSELASNPLSDTKINPTFFFEKRQKNLHFFSLNRKTLGVQPQPPERRDTHTHDRPHQATFSFCYETLILRFSFCKMTKVFLFEQQITGILLGCR
jgi:hypothetical protein